MRGPSLLAAGVSPEIVASRRSLGALQFIEKPYEIADFGAAVQALLGPWNAARVGPSRGARFAPSSLADIVALQCAGRKKRHRGRKGKSAEIPAMFTFSDGQIIHAETDEPSGVDALVEMFSWPDPRLRETAKRVSCDADNSRALGRGFSRSVASSQAGGRGARASKPDRKTGKKIVVIDDTEMLLIFVEDVLSTADPELQITTALSPEQMESRRSRRVLPDLVLLDYSLPDFNGDEVCRQLLQSEQTARIPVLMMSGHVAEMTATAARFENVVATIEKPFLSDAFVDLVRRTLTAQTPAQRRSPPCDRLPLSASITAPKAPATEPTQESP